MAASTTHNPDRMAASGPQLARCGCDSVTTAMLRTATKSNGLWDRPEKSAQVYQSFRSPADLEQ